ncbi:MAG TPA: urease accessory protein UreF [Rhodopila sp.]|jgi:urease accessory protein|nr:urease accessory protein UreF [Rhodopila sp.]
MPAAGTTIIITMTTMTAITTDRRPLLNLLAWLSPAFPTGAFAYSHGLEWAVEAGDIKDGDSLRLWLTDVLALGSGRSDTILLRHAHRSAADLVALREIAALATACAPSRERRDEALNQGRAFQLAVAPWATLELPENAPYPVVVGAASGKQGIPEDDTAVGYLQGFAGNLISAAVRLVPLGQTTGLRVLAALEPVILETADATVHATLDDVGGCAFRSDLAAMRHETQYTRLFRS